MSDTKSGPARRVLLVTGSYAPTMIADMQRARQLAWQLPEAGWEVEILCPGIDYQPPSCNDADSANFFSPAAKVHAVPPRAPVFFRFFGIGNIGLRALVPLYFAGRKLLTARRFDLVYFSTAQFPLFLLGAPWRRRFKIPYVLDLHDPIDTGAAATPGGWKQRASRFFSRFIERHAVAAASGLVAVSPHYLEADANPVCRPAAAMGQTRSASRNSFCRAAARSGGGRLRDRPETTVEPSASSMWGPAALSWRARFGFCARRWRSCGGGIRLCSRTSASSFTARRARSPSDMDTPLARIAGEFDVADLVGEFPARVTYRRSLELLLHGDGALVLGVDDTGYMPSKLASYAYSGKPLLACLHRDGPAFAMLREEPALGHVLWFSQTQEMPLADAAAEVAAYLEEVKSGRTFARQAELAPYTAAAMAARHAQLFEACRDDR